MQAEIKYLLGNNGDRIPYIVADATAIAEGDFLVLGDLMVVTAATTNVDVPVVGIAAHEKVANDGHTSIAAITNCVFKATTVAGGSCTKGDTVSLAATAGTIDLASTLDDEKGWTVGYALEDGGASETVFIRMRK